MLDLLNPHPAAADIMYAASDAARPDKEAHS